MVVVDSFEKKVKAFTLFETLIVVILLTLIVFMGMNLFGKVNEWYISYLIGTKERIERSNLYTHMKWDVQMANEIKKTSNGFIIIQYPNEKIQYEKDQDEIVRVTENGNDRYLVKSDVVLNGHKIYCIDKKEHLTFLIELPFQVEAK